MKYTNKNVLLLISIGINILIFIFGVLLIYRKGGISYIQYQILRIGRKPLEEGWFVNAGYKHKKSQYEILPLSNDSIIFLGDSLTEQGEWLELLGNRNIKNRGISGDTTNRIFNRLDAIIQTQPKQIFLMVGINDFSNENRSIEQVVQGYRTILSELKTQIPDTKVFIQSVLPVNNNLTLFWHSNDRVIQFNLKLQELAKEFNHKYLDIFSRLADSDNQLDTKYTVDGLHLNGKAYLIWKEAIENYVE